MSAIHILLWIDKCVSVRVEVPIPQSSVVETPKGLTISLEDSPTELDFHWRDILFVNQKMTAFSFIGSSFVGICVQPLLRQQNGGNLHGVSPSVLNWISCHKNSSNNPLLFVWSKPYNIFYSGETSVTAKYS